MSLGSFDLTQVPAAANAALFLTGAVVVWLAGTRLAVLADTLAERTGLGHVFVGLILLAAVTELPEAVTSIVATVGGNAPLAVNNLFGGIVLQTAILAIADAALGRDALSYITPRPEVLLQGILLMLLLGLVLVGVIAGELLVVAGVGMWTFAAFVAYLLAVWLVRRFEAGPRWRPVDLPDTEPPSPARQRSGAAGRSVAGLWRAFAAVSLVVLAAGILLVATAEALAEETGLGSSFVGATLLAATTSLPELSTTIAAVRLRAYGMAFANIFGSNAIMVALLFLTDVAYREGPILAAVDASAAFAAAVGIVVTGVYLVGLVMRRSKAFLHMGLDSVIVLLAYAATVYVLYTLRGA